MQHRRWNRPGAPSSCLPIPALRATHTQQAAWSRGTSVRDNRFVVRAPRRDARRLDRRGLSTRERGTVPRAGSRGSRHRVRRARSGRCAEDDGRRTRLGKRRSRRAAGVLRRGQRRRRRRLRRHRAERTLPERRRRQFLARAHWAARPPVSSELELPAAPVDVARPVDRSQPARGGHDPRRHRARWADALDRRRRALAGSPARSAARRSLSRLASARARPRIRGGRRRGRVQRGWWGDVDAGR